MKPRTELSSTFSEKLGIFKQFGSYLVISFLLSNKYNSNLDKLKANLFNH